MKNYSYLYLCAFIVSFCGFLSGFDTGVISGALLYINSDFNINPLMQGVLVSSISMGAILGALSNGIIVDKLGRKKALITIGVIFFTGSIFCFLSKTTTHLILSRLLIGFAVGIASFVGPLYLSEISTKEKRGQIVSFYQLSLTFGILFSYFINYIFSDFDLNWRLMLLFGIVPSAFLFIGMLFLDDTPRWLVLNNKIEKAENLIRKISNKNNSKTEIQNILNSIKTKNKNINLFKKLKKPMIIGIGIMFCQIATGINAIIYYAPTIFKQVGFNSNQDAIIITIFIGVINFLMTFVAIIFVDKLGRKPLLYIGLGGMLFGLIVLIMTFSGIFIKYFAIIAAMLYIVSFSMSLGPIALLLISEIFPLESRGFAMSLAIVSNFIFNFIVTGLFPVSINKLGGCYTFLIFATICILSLLFVYFFIPETKNKTLEDIEKSYKST